MSSIPITKAGLARLKDELKHLKTVERPKNVRDIEEARAHGDLSENAEYHAAKERQSHIAGRIEIVEDWIARAEVVEVGKIKGDTVRFGATVKLQNVDNEEIVVYRIVGEPEADIKRAMVSISSPIARALIGKSVGDDAKVQAPGGVREYEIIEIDFIDG